MGKTNRLSIFVAVAILSFAGAGRAQVVSPFQLLDGEPDNVYLAPSSPTPDQLTNQGGVHFSLDTTYFSTYVWRGVDQSTAPLRNERSLQFDARLSFDLGKLPHPFLGVFSNVFNSDPVSRFEEVRPYFGLEYTLRPVTVAVGFNGYIFPNREGVDTQEVWTSISVDDSRLFHTDHPFLTPYVYGAYDFDKYKGFYIEAGIKHDFTIGETGLVLTVVGDFAYVAKDRYFSLTGPNGSDTGFQHYDAGLIGTYDLINLLHIPRRYGTWEIKGYLYYTGPVESDLRANSRIWGGAGLNFRY
jgi:hypothetical protein